MKVSRETLLYSSNNLHDKNDNKRIRTSAPQYTQYWDAPQKNIKRCKICVDSWDKGKVLSMMAWQHKAIKERTCMYYLDVTSGVVRKLKEVVRYYNKHNLTINTSLVFKGTKSQAIKKLNKLLKSA